MGSKTVSLQINHFQHLKVSRWDKKKSQRDQNGIGATIHKVQRVPVGAHTHKLHYFFLQQRDSSKLIAIWLVIYNINSIQKLMNQENGWSSQYTTVWIAPGCTNDMSPGQRSRTPTMDTKTVSLQTSDFQRSILIKTIQKKSYMDQSHVVMIKDKVQTAPQVDTLS